MCFRTFLMRMIRRKFRMLFTFDFLGKISYCDTCFLARRYDGYCAECLYNCQVVLHLMKSCTCLHTFNLDFMIVVANFRGLYNHIM